MISNVGPVVVNSPKSLVESLYVPVGVWGNPKLTTNALIGPAVVSVLEGIPCLILRMRYLKFSKDSPDLEIKMKGIQGLYLGIRMHKMVLLRNSAAG